MDPTRLNSPYQVGPGGVFGALPPRFHVFNRSDNIITLHPFTITNVNCTPAISNVGGFGCVNLGGAGAATDGSNFCDAVASYKMRAGKQTRMWWGWRAADAAAHAFAFGLTTVTTTFTANHDGGTPAADFLCLTKAATASTAYLRARLNSGTAEAVTLQWTPANDTWYWFEVTILPDETTATQGRILVDVWTPGVAGSTRIADVTSSALPATNAVALAFGMREGDTGTDKTSVSHIGIEQAA